MRYTFLLALVSLAGAVLADGIPVDRAKGVVTVPHEIVTLSPTQQEEVDTLGTLTFDTTQWEGLRKTGIRCARRLAVVPITYSDCTCGLDGYAIAVGVGRVAVLRLQVSGWRLEDELAAGGVCALRMDRRGQFWHEGTLVPFAELLRAVANHKKPTSDADAPSLWLHLPVGVSADSAIAADRIAKLRAAADKATMDITIADQPRH